MGALKRASTWEEACKLAPELQENGAVKQREIKARARGVRERSTIRSKGFSAADVNPEASTSSPLDVTRFAGSLQGKNQTVINNSFIKTLSAFISRTKQLPGAPCSVGKNITTTTSALCYLWFWIKAQSLQMRKLRPQNSADEEQSPNKNRVCLLHIFLIRCSKIPWHLSQEHLRPQIHYFKKHICSKSWVN